jgi:hypothetical protein
MNRARAIALGVAVMALGACGEKARTVGSDAKPSSGPVGSMTTFAAPGWKPGDQNSWEQSLKVRAQYGQNDHAR